MSLSLILLSLFEQFDPCRILVQEDSQQHNNNKHDVFDGEDTHKETYTGHTTVLSRQERKQVVQLVRRIGEQYDVSEDWSESHEL